VRRSLIVGAAYVLVVVVVGLAVPFGFTLSRRLTEDLGGRVERQAFAVAAAAEEPLEAGNTDAVQPLVERLATDVGERILVTDADGVLVADSLQPPGPTPPSYASRPEIARALNGYANWDVRSSQSLGYDILVSAVPISSKGQVMGAVRISYPMSDVQGAIRRSWWFLGAVGAVALLIGLALAAWLARWVTRPLRDAAAVARRISDGDLEARVPEQGPPEVRELARDVNEMTDRLADLVRANREFAANASHQLRTPLAALRLSLEEATEVPYPQAEVAHALDETDRLTAIVDALLAMGGDRAPGTERVDLAEVAAEVVRERPRAGESEGPSVDVEGAGVATANGERVRQVLSNLVDNAVRFARQQVRVRVEPRGESVVVQVDDDGPGVPEGERGRVFDRFYRAPSTRGKGSGLGLAVARELARADGGSVEVSDGDLGGARFEVRYRASGSGDAGGAARTEAAAPA
jgi:signal transduction histidine kinase